MKTSKNGLALIFIVSALLMGCAVPYNNAYVGPVDGQRARLRLSTDGVIRLMPNSACVNFNSPGVGTGPVTDKYAIPLPIDKSNNGKVLGMPGKPLAGETHSELYVRAGEPILIYYQHKTKSEVTGYHLITSSYCNGVFVFTPESGRDYAGLFIGIDRGDRCIRSVVSLDEPVRTIANEFNPAVCAPR